MENLKNQKQVVRERIQTLLRNQKEEERLNKSLEISRKLFKTQEFKEAQTILFYASFDGEVDTFEMIKEAQKLEKRTALPRVNPNDQQISAALVDDLEKDLKDGPFGIKEPKEQAKALSVEDIDVVVVPGVAFDKNNNRLGRGRGYYDRFLKSLPSSVPSIGLAFDFQLLDKLPIQEEHDIPVSKVLVN